MELLYRQSTSQYNSTVINYDRRVFRKIGHRYCLLFLDLSPIETRDTAIGYLLGNPLHEDRYICFASFDHRSKYCCQPKVSDVYKTCLSMSSLLVTRCTQVIVQSLRRQHRNLNIMPIPCLFFVYFRSFQTSNTIQQQV